MFTALRERFRKRQGSAIVSTWEPRAPSPEPELDAQAKVDALKEYLESLSEDDRAEFITVANDFAAAMNEVGANSIHACYRGGATARTNTPAGIKSVEEMRFLTKLLRSIPPEKTPDTPSNAKVDAVDGDGAHDDQ